MHIFWELYTGVDKRFWVPYMSITDKETHQCARPPAETTATE